MSREQWGSGYWKGRKDERENKDGHQYLCIYDSDTDPYVNSVAQIRGKNGDTLTVEWIYIWDLSDAVQRGYEPSWEKYVLENIEELTEDDLKSRKHYHHHKLFYRWETVAGEIVKASNMGHWL